MFSENKGGMTLRHHDIAINLATLKFTDKALEEAFRNDYYEKALSRVRFSLLLAVFLYGIFGILDGMIVPQIQSVALGIRFLAICPLILITFVFTFTPYFKKWMQPLFCGGK